MDTATEALLRNHRSWAHVLASLVPVHMTTANTIRSAESRSPRHQLSLQAKMRDEAPGTEGSSQHKVFVGGLSYSIQNADLKAAFDRFDATDAEVMIDRHSNRPRGFGFVYFKDEHGLKEAIAQMHDKELDGRRISVVKAVPQDQTKPGTPAAALGGGTGARRDYGRRDYPPRYDRGYDRGYGGGGGYDRSSYDRGGYGGYDPRYAYDRGGYDYRGYSSDPYRDAYSRSGYGAYGYGYDDRGYGSGSYGYERGYEDRYDDRGAGGPERRGYSSGARSAPYDRPPADRRPSDPPRR